MKNFAELMEQAKAMGPYTVCVAAAEDVELLTALRMAVDMGFVKPLLTGDREKIAACAAACGLVNYETIHCVTQEEAAAEAVAAVRDGRADILMKGLVNTSVYMRAVLNKERGLRTGRLIGMLAVYEMPAYHKLLFGTDSGINPAPGMEQKKELLSSALEAMSQMGLVNPKVAALTANEMVDPKISSTVDADGLVSFVKSGGTPPCVIEGPVAFDVAFDKHAAEHKGIKSEISGDVDLIVFPNMETGNALGKSWLRFNEAKWAGVVLGASKPIILGSRSDTAEIKINSIALGCLISGKK